VLISRSAPRSQHHASSLGGAGAGTHTVCAAGYPTTPRSFGAFHEPRTNARTFSPPPQARASASTPSVRLQGPPLRRGRQHARVRHQIGVAQSRGMRRSRVWSQRLGGPQRPASAPRPRSTSTEISLRSPRRARPLARTPRARAAVSSRSIGRPTRTETASRRAAASSPNNAETRSRRRFWELHDRPPARSRSTGPSSAALSMTWASDWFVHNFSPDVDSIDLGAPRAVDGHGGSDHRICLQALRQPYPGNHPTDTPVHAKRVTVVSSHSASSRTGWRMSSPTENAAPAPTAR